MNDLEQAWGATVTASGSIDPMKLFNDGTREALKHLQGLAAGAFWRHGIKATLSLDIHVRRLNLGVIMPGDSMEEVTTTFLGLQPFSKPSRVQAWRGMKSGEFQVLAYWDGAFQGMDPQSW